jgi:hypothetical protein
VTEVATTQLTIPLPEQRLADLKAKAARVGRASRPAADAGSWVAPSTPRAHARRPYPFFFAFSSSRFFSSVLKLSLTTQLR